MQQDLVQRLNQLNSDFYQKINTSFNQTRQYFWPGWSEALVHLDLEPTSILDVGCGNGRWLDFLSSSLAQPFSYVGIDNSPELLAFAQQKNQGKTNISFEEVDIIDHLIHQQPLSNQTFEMIGMFGVMHHIPAFENRLSLLLELYRLTKPGGYCLISLWQFKKDPQLMKRAIDPTLLMIDQKKLEPGDYILDWQRETQAYRYCHLVNQEEQTKLLTQTSWQLQAEFDQDGKELMNHYLVLQRP